MNEEILGNAAENEEMEEVEIYTLIDENGEECEFECVAKYEEGDDMYFAMLPLNEEGADEYVILKLDVDENGEDALISVDDDAEFDKISDIFDDILFNEVDYDQE